MHKGNTRTTAVYKASAFENSIADGFYCSEVARKWGTTSNWTGGNVPYLILRENKFTNNLLLETLFVMNLGKFVLNS